MEDEAIVVDGLGFLEAPRWHDGELWFSDFYSRRVSSVDGSGTITVRVYVPGQPSGLGFCADGALLIVSTHDGHLLRWDGASLTVVADIGAVYRGGGLNDMTVDRFGRAYVAALPDWNLRAATASYENVAARGVTAQTVGEPPTGPSVPLFLVDEKGEVRIVAEDLKMPNGMALTPDGTTLIVAETQGNRLLAFDIAGDGALFNQRTFAGLGERMPDGICLDANGHVWVGSPFTSEFVLVEEGGHIVRTIPTPGLWAVACALGGTDGRTLYGLTARITVEEYLDGRGTGAVKAYRVDVPAA